MTKATAGQKGQTRGPASAREADVRQEAKDAASCFFNDLCHLNGDRPRGAPSKEYLERVTGTITWSTGTFVCTIIWRLQPLHEVVEEDEEDEDGGRTKIPESPIHFSGATNFFGPKNEFTSHSISVMQETRLIDERFPSVVGECVI